jgi:glycosyltransferase involved in cell wall biosynthesis
MTEQPTMQPVKILFLMNSLTFGGAERQTIDLINGLNKDIFSIGLLYLNKIEDLKPSIKVKNLLFCECLEREGKFDFSILGKIQNIVLTYDIQIIICVEEYTLLYAYLYRLIFRNSLIKISTVIHHTLPPPGLWTQVKRLLYRILINSTDKVFFVCNNQAQYWQSNNGIKKSISTVIYNGIDSSYFAPDNLNISEKNRLRESLLFTEKDFIVGICARLNPVKCHIDFLTGLAKAKKSGVRIKGLLIGDGPERANITKTARQLGLMNDILITGFVSDVRPHIAVCDCLAITSDSEAFSISALEAMAMAKPLIMTRIGGAKEQIQDRETGFLYTAGETDDLALHMIWLGKNRKKSREMGNKARDFLLNNFTLITMTKCYEIQLLKILG